MNVSGVHSFLYLYAYFSFLSLAATGFWSELVDENIPDLSLPSIDDIDL